MCWEPRSSDSAHLESLCVAHTTTTQRRSWYGCENCGPLLTPGCHLGLPGDGSPAGAGACIYLGSVPTLHYSAQPAHPTTACQYHWHWRLSRWLNLLPSGSTSAFRFTCFCPDLANFTHFFSFVPILFAWKLHTETPLNTSPHTAVALKWKQSDFLQYKYLKTDYFL